MEIKINIKKGHFQVLLIVFLVGIFSFYVIGYHAGGFDPNAPTHELVQIINNGGASVDQDEDGVIDLANYASASGAVYANSRHDIDDTTEYYMNTLERYHITATATNYGGKTKQIDHTILTDLCGDFDGCDVRFGMTRWSNTWQTETANRKQYALYYSPNDGRWRLQDDSGVDNDGTTQHVISIWSTCYFTDGDYDSYSNQGDLGEGFNLLVWNGYGGAERTCELTLID